MQFATAGNAAEPHTYFLTKLMFLSFLSLTLYTHTDDPVTPVSVLTVQLNQYYHQRKLDFFVALTSQ